MTKAFPYLLEDKDRHGNPRVYVRRDGKRIRLRARRGTAAFAKEYADALEGIARPKPPPRSVLQAPTRGTLGWLAALYFNAPEFTNLDLTSQRTRRGIIESCLRELHKGDPMRDCPVEHVTPAKIKTLRDAKSRTRGAANNRLKYLSAMFSWAIEAGHMTGNPARDVKRFRYASDGFHSWTVEEVHRFEEIHPIGTKARLAFALLLFLGVRRGDLVHLGPEMIRDGSITFIPRKTRYKRLTPSTKPILPELADVIAASPIGAKMFLETAFWKPFTAAGIGQKMREWCNVAGLPNCSAHGLRKAGAAIAAERGATVHQLMAIYDWATPAQAETYTRAADRKRLAGEAMGLLGRQAKAADVR
jgi:integrase